MYCQLCLEDGEHHQHLKHICITNAMKNFSQRWAELKEYSLNIFGHATNYISQFLPLIQHLEKLSVEEQSGLLARFPVPHMISQDYQSLNALKIKVTDITGSIDSLIKSGQALNLIKLDMGFNAMRDQLNTLTYLSGLNENFLFKNYAAALRDNSNTSSFEGFTQPCRDSFMRLKFRTMADCTQSSASVNIRCDANNIDSVELESLIKAIGQKIALSS